MDHTEKARAAFARFARATAPRRADALRALDLKADHVAATFRPLAAERREAFERFQAELRAIHAEATAHMEQNEPAAIDRALVMAKAERQAAAASARALLASAPLAELLTVARDAAQRRDAAVAYAVRAIVSSRSDLTPDDAAPVLDALDAPHAEAYGGAILDVLGVQLTVHHATLGGPMALPHAAALLEPVKAGGSYHSATTVETPRGPRRFRESEVLALLPAEALVPPQDARPDGDHRALLDAVRAEANAEVMRHRAGLAA